MLSSCCSKTANKYEVKIRCVNKLVPNLGNETKYVLHYMSLQLHLSLGMKVQKKFKFRQSNC